VLCDLDQRLEGHSAKPLIDTSLLLLFREGFGEGANEESPSADISVYAGCFEANGMERVICPFISPVHAVDYSPFVRLNCCHVRGT
jgi:hypothetical protein